MSTSVKVPAVAALMAARTQCLGTLEDDPEERLCGVRVGVLVESAPEAAASSDMSSDIAMEKSANGRKRKQAPGEIGRR
jgi:hypothetical protein